MVSAHNIRGGGGRGVGGVGGLEKNRRYSELAVVGGSITLKNPIWDLKWVAVLGGGGTGRGGIERDDFAIMPVHY